VLEIRIPGMFLKLPYLLKIWRRQSSSRGGSIITRGACPPENNTKAV
jgi:hypothetical protein